MHCSTCYIECIIKCPSHAGSGSGAGNIGMCGMDYGEWLYDTVTSVLHIYNAHTCIVEVGFTMGAYTVSESELKAVVCVQVTAGMLTPAEIALVTVSTLPDTAQGM